MKRVHSLVLAVSLFLAASHAPDNNGATEAASRTQGATLKSF